MQYIIFFSCQFRSNPKQVSIIYFCAPLRCYRLNISAPEQEEARGMIFPEDNHFAFWEMMAIRNYKYYLG